MYTKYTKNSMLRATAMGTALLNFSLVDEGWHAATLPHSDPTILVSFPSASDAETLNEEPVIGTKSPFHAPSKFLQVIASAQMDAAYYARYKEILFIVTVNRDNRISFISTEDTDFRIGGFQIGTSLDPGGQINELDWACFSKISADWYAGALLVGPKGECDNKVAFFFKRGDLASVHRG